MPDSSIIRKKFFQDYTDPNSVVQPANSLEVTAILGDFSLDSEEVASAEQNFWTASFAVK